MRLILIWSNTEKCLWICRVTIGLTYHILKKIKKSWSFKCANHFIRQVPFLCWIYYDSKEYLVLTLDIMTHMKYPNAQFSVVLGGITFHHLWLHGIEEAHEGEVRASPWYPTNDIRHMGVVMAPRRYMFCIWLNVPPVTPLGMLTVGPQQHCHPHGLCMDSTMTGGLFLHSTQFIYLFIFGIRI